MLIILGGIYFSTVICFEIIILGSGANATVPARVAVVRAPLRAGGAAGAAAAEDQPAAAALHRPRRYGDVTGVAQLLRLASPLRNVARAGASRIPIPSETQGQFVEVDSNVQTNIYLY